MTKSAQVSDWIAVENVLPFYWALSQLADESFDTVDGQAVASAIRTGRVTYPLGENVVATAVVEAGTGVLIVNVRVPEALRPAVDVLIALMQEWEVQRRAMD